jgi:hypothetical protein
MPFLPCLPAAKRIPPAKVAPVVYEGIRYVAPNDDGRRAYIEAQEIQTNRKLWDLTVFHTVLIQSWRKTFSGFLLAN